MTYMRLRRYVRIGFSFTNALALVAIPTPFWPRFSRGEPISWKSEVRTGDMRPRRQLLTCALFAALLLGACGGQEAQETARAALPSAEATATPESAPTNDGAEEARVSAKIIDTDFRPVTLNVTVGSRVDWKQVGDQPHSVTASDGSFDSSPDCGPLDTDKCLGEGDAFSFTFEQPGEFEYYCRVHGLPDGTGMVGTIIVK